MPTRTLAQAAVEAARTSPTLEIPEVAHAFGIARETAYRMAKAGQIPTIRVGKRGLRVPSSYVLSQLGLDAEVG